MDWRHTRNINAYPLPWIDDTQETLIVGIITTVLDPGRPGESLLTVEIESGDQQKTAFSQLQGCLNFKSCPLAFVMRLPLFKDSLT